MARSWLSLLDWESARIDSAYHESASALALDHLRSESLEVLLLVQGPDDAEADEGGVGMPPDALGPLRVLDAPLGVGPASLGAAEQFGVVVPRAAPDDIGILLGVGQDDRARGRLVPRILLVGVGQVMVQAPLGHVAVHVVEPPRVGLLLADMHRLLGVIDVPGVLLERGGMVAPGIGRFGAGAAGIFPFGLG